ncbi:MAG: patatin-like phospholipase family protein [Beijerinckiaceae bacterium]
MDLIETARTILRGQPADLWPPRDVSLALQGGGSFGAFTWGVLDRLVEEPDLHIDTISGASAGAVNAVLVASGLAEGGRDAAKEKLEHFWRRMSESAAFMSLANAAHIPGLAAGSFGALARAFSPYQFNPLDLNPLRKTLAAEVDFDRLRVEAPVHLMIAATRVSDGKLRIFRNDDISLDAVLASACLPQLHRAVEVEGELYWDGGYVANPPLVRLVHESETSNVLVVQITPVRIERAPTTSGEIARRLEQITFNSSLNSDFDTLELATEIGASRKIKNLKIDRIVADELVENLAEKSAADLDWRFLTQLRDSGRLAADKWLRKPSEH